MEDRLAILYIIQMIVVFSFVIIMLLPGIVASRRNHRNHAAIWAVTIIFGWTLLGWGVALVWALTESTQETQASSPTDC